MARTRVLEMCNLILEIWPWVQIQHKSKELPFVHEQPLCDIKPDPTYQ